MDGDDEFDEWQDAEVVDAIPSQQQKVKEEANEVVTNLQPVQSHQPKDEDNENFADILSAEKPSLQSAYIVEGHSQEKKVQELPQSSNQAAIPALNTNYLSLNDIIFDNGTKKEEKPEPKSLPEVPYTFTWTNGEMKQGITELEDWGWGETTAEKKTEAPVTIEAPIETVSKEEIKQAQSQEEEPVNRIAQQRVQPEKEPVQQPPITQTEEEDDGFGDYEEANKEVIVPEPAITPQMQAQANDLLASLPDYSFIRATHFITNST